jgi:hypothetical protein
MALMLSKSLSSRLQFSMQKLLALFFLSLATHIRASTIILANSSITASSLDSYNASDPITSQILDSPFPYNFPNILTPDPADLFPMPVCNGFMLEEATIDEMQDAMAKGQLTSVQIAMCYLRRVWQVDEYVR